MSVTDEWKLNRARRWLRAKSAASTALRYLINIYRQLPISFLRCSTLALIHFSCRRPFPFGKTTQLTRVPVITGGSLLQLFWMQHAPRTREVPLPARILRPEPHANFAAAFVFDCFFSRRQNHLLPGTKKRARWTGFSHQLIDLLGYKYSYKRGFHIFWSPILYPLLRSNLIQRGKSLSAQLRLVRESADPSARRELALIERS